MEDEQEVFKSRCGLERYFLRQHSIMVYGDITKELAYNVVGEMKYLKNKGTKLITLNISSEGGDFDSACAIIDYMQILQANDVIVKTIVEGGAYSGGCYIAGFGTIGERYATKNSLLMLHETYSGSGPEYLSKSEKALEASKNQTNHLIDSFARHIGYKTKKQIDKFINEVKNDLWMDVDSAIKYKVIDSEV